VARAVQSQQTTQQLNPVQRAIRLLKSEYQTRLSSHEFDDVVEVLESKYKASTFIELDSADRDRWIQRNAHIQLEAEDNEII
jgi:hypothetical protein